MRYTKILAPVAAVLLLAGCSASPQDAYLGTLHGKVAVTKKVDDKVLLQAGRMICDDLHMGATRYELVSQLSGNTDFMSTADVAAMVNAAGDHLCPEEGK